MDWHYLLTAIALLLIIEGLLPFINPSVVKRVYQALQEMPERSLRIFGFSSIVAGLILLYLV